MTNTQTAKIKAAKSEVKRITSIIEWNKSLGFKGTNDESNLVKANDYLEWLESYKWLELD